MCIKYCKQLNVVDLIRNYRYRAIQLRNFIDFEIFHVKSIFKLNSKV